MIKSLKEVIAVNNEILFKNLRNLRKSHRLTQEDVAGIVGKDRSLIAKYESGKAVPPLNMLRMFAKLYNVTVETLCGGADGTDETLVLSTDTKLSESNQIYFPELSDSEKELICRLRLSGEDKINEILDSLGLNS